MVKKLKQIMLILSHETNLFSNKTCQLFRLDIFLVCLLTFLCGNVQAAAVKEHLTSMGGLKWIEPCNADYWMKVGGRIHLDETLFTGDYQSKQKDFPSGARVRRAYLELSGGVGERFAYYINLNFKGNLVDFDKAYLNYRDAFLSFQTNVKVGQLKPLLPIEMESSSNDLLFLERSLANTAFFSTTNRALGIIVETSACDLFTIGAIIFQPRQNDTEKLNNVDSINNYWVAAKSDRLGEALKINFSPIHKERMAVHFGINLRHQALNSSFRGIEVIQNRLFSTPPEARARNTAELITTGSQIRAKAYHHGIIEAASIIGPVTLMGEYHTVEMLRVPRLARADIGNIRFKAWYIQGGYVLTGESRVYDFAAGTIGTVKPESACGAWEVTTRLSSVNLNDKNVYGGREENFSLGLCWYINQNIRILTNYIKARIHPAISGPIFNPLNIPEKRILNIFATRLQITF